MGRAARWLRSFLGGAKKPPPPPPSTDGADLHLRSKHRRWGFGKSFREKGTPVSVTAAAAAAQVTPQRSEKAGILDEDEQSRRAIAVAAATAAAAEAAIVAAQAAAAVVRLTNSGRAAVASRRDDAAAIRIQAAFRGYCARRALKALRGLVKLQALVRGNIVRRQAAETLRCMHSLVRVQARARALRSASSAADAGGSLAAFQVHECVVADANAAARSDRSISLKRCSSRTAGASGPTAASRDRSKSCGRNCWLDRWIEEKHIEDERNAKILEVDNGNGKPRHGGGGSRRRSSSNAHSSSSTTMTLSEHNSRSYATVTAGDLGSQSRDSTNVQVSVPSPSSVGMTEALSPLRLPAEIIDLGESPQFYSAKSRPGSASRRGGGTFTPAKSECSRSLFGGYTDYPNYMSNTESSRAKARSQSAPKQRPEYECFSGVPLVKAPAPEPGRSLAAAANRFAVRGYPGSGRLDKLGMPMIKY